MRGGPIKLESTPGAGTRASFWIPFKKAEYLQDATPLVELGSITDRLQSDVSVSCNGSDARSGAPSPPAGRANVERSPLRGVRGFGTPQSVQNGAETFSAADRNSVHVLVVEDNHINQQIALKTIKKLNFSVSAVWNGQEALDYLLASETGSDAHPVPNIILSKYQCYHFCNMFRSFKTSNKSNSGLSDATARWVWSNESDTKSRTFCKHTLAEGRPDYCHDCFSDTR